MNASSHPGGGGGGGGVTSGVTEKLIVWGGVLL